MLPLQKQKYCFCRNIPSSHNTFNNQHIRMIRILKISNWQPNSWIWRVRQSAHCWPYQIVEGKENSHQTSTNQLYNIQGVDVIMYHTDRLIVTIVFIPKFVKIQIFLEANHWKSGQNPLFFPFYGHLAIFSQHLWKLSIPDCTFYYFATISWLEMQISVPNCQIILVTPFGGTVECQTMSRSIGQEGSSCLGVTSRCEQTLPKLPKAVWCEMVVFWCS